MGVYVRLSIDPEGIVPAAWKDFYRQARDFLTGHPDGLVGLRREPVKGTTRLVYSRQLEHEPQDPAQRHLRVSGDLASMTHGESFCLYEDLGHYRTRQPSTVPRDLLRAVLKGDQGVTVFSEKTQGHPYHLAVLGVAILAEGRFPDCALVSGDINRDQCLDALRTLEEQCGIRAPIPLLVDADRLYAALIGATPCLESMDRYVCAGTNPEEHIRVLQRHVARETLLDWLAAQVGQHEGRVTLGVLRRFRQWLNAIGDLDGLIDAVCCRPVGPQLAPEPLASALVATGITLDPDRLAGLDRLDRPATTPDSVYSQLGNAMLDIMGASARNCRYRLGVAAVVARLHERFPAHGDACRETIERETATLVQKLRDLGAQVAHLSEDAEGEEESGDGESFVRHQSGAQLSPAQTLILDEFGAALRPLWDDWQSGLGGRFGTDVEARHGRLMHVAESQMLALTESGWAWIDAEQDAQMFDLMLLLLSQDDRAELFTNLRRGLFEYRDLCDYLRMRVVGR